MKDFLATLKAETLLADGAMGSYLFELTGRLSETNHIYEAFNAEQPDLIQKVHLAYLAAGARWDVVPAIEAGATGYLLKDSPPDELRRGVRAAARGEAVLSPSVATRLVGQVREPAKEPLSQRELDVLALIARGCSNREAAARLFISEATVKTHVLHVYAKLGVNDPAPAARPGGPPPGCSSGGPRSSLMCCTSTPSSASTPGPPPWPPASSAACCPAPPRSTGDRSESMVFSGVTAEQE